MIPAQSNNSQRSIFEANNGKQFNANANVLGLTVEQRAIGNVVLNPLAVARFFTGFIFNTSLG